VQKPNRKGTFFFKIKVIAWAYRLLFVCAIAYLGVFIVRLGQAGKIIVATNKCLILAQETIK
jgi:hypothetical protein